MLGRKPTSKKLLGRTSPNYVHLTIGKLHAYLHMRSKKNSRDSYPNPQLAEHLMVRVNKTERTTEINLDP